MLPSIVADRDELRRRQEAHATQLASAAALLRQQRLLKTVAGMPALQPRTTAVIPATDLKPLVTPVAERVAATARPPSLVHTTDAGLVLVGSHAPLLGTPTGAVVDREEPGAASWGVRVGTFCGIAKLKVLCYAHLAAALLHLTLFVATLVVGADSPDPYIRVSRQQLLFTRLDNSSCNLADLEANETNIVSINIDNGMPMDVVGLSAMFFALSCLFHSVWALGTSGAAPRLETFLVNLLTRCCNPLR